MAKTKISEFSSTPANNTDIDSINIAEGCAPSGINDAIRELMAQLKDWQSGTSNDPYVVGSSGSLTLNQGTANGVAYLNGSKVVTSGSALTYNGTTLQNSVSGNAATALANVTNSNSGSSSRAVYSFNSDTASGSIGVVSSTWNVDALSTNETYLYGSNGIALYAPSSQVIRFLANGSEQMRLTSTGLGIGTSTVGARLTTQASANSYVAGALQINSLSGTYKSYITNVGGLLLFSNSSTVDQLILDTSGNLGLGVTPSAWTSPDFRGLQVGSGIAVYGRGSGDADRGGLAANCYNDGSWKYIATGNATRAEQSDGTHAFFTAPSGTAGNAITFTQALTLTAGGNLLVGTTTNYGSRIIASAANGTAYSSTPQLRISGGSTNNNRAAIVFSDDNLQDGKISYYPAASASNSYFSFSARATESDMILDGAGNLLVGTTSTMNGVGSDGKIGLQSSGASGNFVVQNSGDDNIYLAKVSGYSNSTFIRFSVNGTGVGSVTTNGTNTTYATSSDYRLKNTIAPMTGALAKVAQLKPCTYKWNADGSDGEGFIAHELQAIIPDAVVGEKDAVDENGNIKAQGIDTSFLVATLTAAIQEQQAIIESLKARLDAANL